MKTSIDRLCFVQVLAPVVLATMPIATYGQSAVIAGPNVRLTSGIVWPGSDPFKERQNEVSCAPSPANPRIIFCGSNDYSTVQLGLITDSETGDAWQRFYTSTDNGATWTSTLLPGCPYTTPECVGAPFGSPVRDAGFQFAADPILRFGGRMLYYGFLAANRGNNAAGAAAIARLIHDNNSDQAGAVQARYLGTTLAARNTPGKVQDKPWMTVDAFPRLGASPCRVPSSGGAPEQILPGGNVYFGYATLQGNGENTHARVFVETSNDCMASLSKSIKVSEGSAIAQGVTMAVDPRPAPLGGALYVAWRQFQHGRNEPDAIMVVKSVDGGQKFTKPTMVAAINAFDQGSSLFSARISSFPSIAVNQDGLVILVWSDRVGPPASAPATDRDARVVRSISTDGLAWSAPVQIYTPPPTSYNPASRGHQFQPSVAIAFAQEMVGFYESHDDHTVAELKCTSDFPAPPATSCLSTAPALRTTSLFKEVRQAAGELDPASPFFDPAKVFNKFLADATPGSGFTSSLPQRRHTIDFRVVRATSGPSPTFTSAKASQYPFGTASLTPPGSKPIKQLRFNPPGIPIYANNTRGMIGDYPKVAVQMMSASPNPGFHFNTAFSNSAVFHAFWTTNEFIIPPPDGNFAISNPPTYAGYFGSPPMPIPACADPNRAGMKDQEIVTSAITQGAVFGALQTAKKVFLTDGSTPVQRKFVVTIQNTRNKTASFQLTIAPPAAGVTASFKQSGPPVTTISASVAGRSTIAQTVFVSSTDPSNALPTVIVNITELNGAPGGCDPGGCLQGSVGLNADLTNTDLTNADLTNADLTNADLTNGVLSKADLTNTDLTNADLTNADLTNVDLTNADLTNTGVPAADLTNADLTNADLTNADLTNSVMTAGNVVDANWKMTNTGRTGAAVSIKTLLNGGTLPPGFKGQLILHKSYKRPVVLRDPANPLSLSCELKEVTQHVLLANIANPRFLDPNSPTLGADLTNTDLTNTDLTNAVIPIGAGETVKATLRFIDPDKLATPNLCGPGIAPCGPTDFNPLENAKPVPVPQSINFGQTQPGIALTITTFKLPDGVSGLPFTATVKAVGGIGARTWSLIGAPGWLTISVDVNGNGPLSGTPPAAGTFSFTAKVTDSSTPTPQEDTQDLTIRVGGPLLITTASLPAAVVGEPYTATLTATGGLGDRTWSISVGSLPGGLSLNPATGVISGIPTTPGISNFTAQVTDSGSPMQINSKSLGIGVYALGDLIVANGSPFGSDGSILRISADGSSSTTIATVATPGCPDSIAIDKFGNFFAADPCVGSRILKITPSGTVTTLFAGAPLAGPVATAVDMAGNIIVGDNSTDKIYRIPPGGGSATEIATVPFSSNLQDIRIAVDPATGDIIVASDEAGGAFSVTSEIRRIASNGTVTTIFSGSAIPNVGGLAIDLAGNYIVSSFGSGTSMVSRVTPVGVVTTITSDSATLCCNMAGSATDFSGNTIAVVNGLTGSPRILKVTTAGAITTVKSGSPLTFPNDIAIFKAYTVAGFSATGSMGTARVFHTASLLPNGKVLIAGGAPGSSGPGTTSAELYNPTTGAFGSAGSMTVPRFQHTATRLLNGKVFITGGFGADLFTVHSSSELYDPDAGTFTGAADMGVPRNRHSAILLRNGKVLVVGGAGGPLASAQLYDPAGNSFSSAGSMSVGRQEPELTLLPDGKVLVSGGAGASGSLNSAEVYDPVMNTFGPASNTMGVARFKHAAVPLPNGKVLVSGGNDGATVHSTADLYDLGTNMFSATGSMAAPRTNHTATLLFTGKNLVAGGFNGATFVGTAELYDHVAAGFSATPNMTGPRQLHRAIALPNGKVLMVGGENGGGALPTAELYSPAP